MEFVEIQQLMTEAERVVAATQRRLPAKVRALAEALPVVCQDRVSPDVAAQMGADDLLGLFVGAPFGAADTGSGDIAAHILLYVGEIYDFAEGDWEVFREEVRLTYLHELGHYLGWDEEEVARRGLE